MTKAARGTKGTKGSSSSATTTKVDKTKTEATATTTTGGSTMTKTAATTTPKVDKTNGNGNGNHSRTVKLADMKVVNLTRKAFGDLTPEQLVTKIIDPTDPNVNRLSRERAKAMLVKRIEDGKIKITDAEVLMHLTFNSVRVDGVDTNGFGFKAENAKVKLTQEEFSKLTPKQIASYVEQYSHKRRIADSIIPAYIKVGMPMSAEDIVYLTCGRINIAGVTVQTTSKKQPVPTTGVQFD